RVHGIRRRATRGMHLWGGRRDHRPRAHCDRMSRLQNDPCAKPRGEGVMPDYYDINNVRRDHYPVLLLLNSGQEIKAFLRTISREERTWHGANRATSALRPPNRLFVQSTELATAAVGARERA